VKEGKSFLTRQLNLVERDISLAIPPNVLARADSVIK